MVDVWQGYREGNRNLNAALDEYSANQRQRQLDEQNAAAQKLQMGLAQQNLEKGALDLAETKRKAASEEGFRRFATSPSAMATTSNPAYEKWMANKTLEAASMGPEVPQSGIDYYKSLSPQAQSEYNDLPGRIASWEGSNAALQLARGNVDESLAQSAAPESTMKVAKDPIRLRIEYGMQQGDMQMVQDAKKQAYDRITQIGARIGDSDEAMQRLTGMWNEMTGENVAYLGKRDKYNILQDKDTGKITAVNPQDPTDMIVVAEGTKQQKTEVRTMTSPDGKTKQDWIVDATTNERIKPFSEPYKVASQVPKITVSTGAGGKSTGKDGKILPAGQLESLSDAAQIIKTLEEAQGISPKVNTGAASGRVQSLGQYVGASGEDFNQFKQKLATANNIMLKLRSGAAVTESEYARFLQEMPTVNDDEKIRDTKLQNAINYARELLTNKSETFREGGYKVPEGVVGRSKASSAPKADSMTTKGGFKVRVK